MLRRYLGLSVKFISVLNITFCKLMFSVDNIQRVSHEDNDNNL